MTEIQALPPSLPEVVSSTGVDSSATSGTKLNSDFETFLRMLTAQVQNQDPLNPVESTEYATQLATFSSVEQQVLTNDLLKELGVRIGGNDLQHFGNWIGKEALVRAPVRFDGSPFTVFPDFAENADRSILIVRNENGDPVQRLNVEVGEDRVLWSGTTMDGRSLPSGSYRFEVESYSGDSLLETKRAAVYEKVEEVRSVDGQVMIRLSSGTEIEPSFVEGLRSAELL
ncbi:flagellar hook capping FlgD N-terminal domain-containing protein [Pseudoponticoccus marisrubri]|uniref:flagellar hook capping FlgD N-terminal domain-containing protein n=1 Tax=Pseudoponticoccus marisrubri TaxID=1685382 RepID=UPI000A020A4A|nr:flagellar hook capping FlgD N-terminal domain-containing protein [Pseudoponticoccus marisrubri]